MIKKLLTLFLLSIYIHNIFASGLGKSCKFRPTKIIQGTSISKKDNKQRRKQERGNLRYYSQNESICARKTVSLVLGLTAGLSIYIALQNQNKK